MGCEQWKLLYLQDLMKLLVYINISRASQSNLNAQIQFKGIYFNESLDRIIYYISTKLVGSVQLAAD